MTGRALRAGLYGCATEPLGTASQPLRVTIPSRGSGAPPRPAAPACRLRWRTRRRHGTAMPGGGYGCEYRRPAAERLRLVVWWPGPPCGARRAAFFRPWEFSLYPVFPAQSLFLQKCAPVLPSLRGVSIKGAALRVLRTFYKPSPHILVMPVAPILRATAREKRGEKRYSQGLQKKRRRA